MGRSTGKNRDANAAARALQALNLRKLGATYEVIAQQCGYGSRAAAYNAVQRELSRTLQEPADDVRKMELERLDALMAVMMPRAIRGDKDSTWHVDRVLAIMERRAKLLGLDAKESTQAAPPIIREYQEGILAAV